MPTKYEPGNRPPPRGKTRKMAFLLGEDKASKEVWYLVKIHDWAGKAIYYYDLRENGKIIERLTGSDPNFKVAWSDCEREGWLIKHPAIPYRDEERWYEHAQREAERLGLKIAAQ